MFFIDFLKRFRDKHGRKTSFLILLSFLGTFIIARFYALIAAPVFIYRDVHVHHLNYGIAFLSLSGFLSFYLSNSKWRNKIIVFYGIGLGLTFDEFAMWLRLEDHYWMRSSYDAIIIISAILMNIVFFSDFWQRMLGKAVFGASKAKEKYKEIRGNSKNIKRP